jgi:5-methylcytosine-specific restriction endonuclease McrA
VRGRALQRRRQQWFMQHPLCAECERNGRTTEGKILDHIIPLAEGGAENDPQNWQTLCGECSEAKTREESRRGAAQGGVVKNF